MYPPILPLVEKLTPGTTQRHSVKLPGNALVNDEPRAVITVTGAKPGPTLFVNGGLHGAEYPAIEAVIRLGKELDPAKISGTVILMPVLNMPAFRNRTPFVCPVDNVNPNRVFPGDPEGSYSEQMVYALVNEFIAHADAYIDLHGGDIPEDLVPFVICRAGTGTGQAVNDVDVKSQEMAMAFGLPYVLTVSKPVQVAKGSSSYVGAAERGVPAILAEAGAVGQLQFDAVEVLVIGVMNVMRQLGMMAPTAKLQVPSTKLQGSSKPQTSTRRGAADPKMLTAFEWVYSKHSGMWYSRVAAGDLIEKGQEIGAIGSLFGETLETIIAPVSGYVLFLTINPSVQEKGLLMGIGAE